MEQQMALLEAEQDDFRLDDHTKEVGRRGIAEVRRMLSEARMAAERLEKAAA